MKKKSEYLKKNNRKQPPPEVAESAAVLPYPAAPVPPPPLHVPDLSSGTVSGTGAAPQEVPEETSFDLKNGHRSCLRSRYLKAGPDGMTDYDVLELLLTYPILRKDVKPLSRRLMEQFKTLGGVLDAELNDLAQVKGLSENSALLFKLVRDLCVRYLKERIQDADVISSPDALADYARMKLGEYREEVIMIIYMNVKNRVIDSDIVSRGTVDSAIVYPRTIAAGALMRKAAGVILVHNHPSGDVRPSEEDRDFTRRVQRSLEALDIRLHDHLIVSRTGSFSFHDKHLL